MKKIGVIENYFSKISVAVLNLSDGDLKVGDTIHIKGATTDYSQKVESMQIEREEVEKVNKGQKVGFKTTERVRKTDEVFLVEE